MNLEDVVSRVLAISSVSGDRDASSSEAILVRDFFSRVSSLAKDVGEWNSGPFFDPEKLIGISPDDNAKAAIDHLNSAGSQRNAYVKRICSDAIKWASYVSLGNSIAVNHPDVYEPLLLLFERQVDFGFHHGDLIIGDLSIPVGTWRSAEESSLH